MKRLLILFPAIFAALGLSVASAMASNGLDYTVEVGSNTSGDWDITAENTTGINFQVMPASGVPVDMTCDAVEVPAAGGTAQVHAGSGITDIVTFDSSEWIGCIGPGGAMAVDQCATWTVHGTDPNVTPALTDRVEGHVEVPCVQVSNPVCSFTVSGDANGIFDEAAQTLEVAEVGFTGNLTVDNVVGCLGAFTNGDPADFAGDFDVDSPDGDINLVSQP